MRFEDLEVWNRSARLSADIYRAFALSKDWGFKDQITRSSLSIPSNIAEGFERLSNKECIQFLSYAKGSTGELRTQVHIGVSIGYIERQTGSQWISETQEISKMLAGLIRTRKQRT
tara:strand:- start:293 stop:640 length:348 start_codon:yes stop_codon:yes gene_type:complete